MHPAGAPIAANIPLFLLGLGRRAIRAEAVMNDTFLTRYAPAMLSILRIVTALLFFEHGLSKVFGFPQGTVRELFTLGWYSGVIEFAGGALLAVGLFSRTAAFIMSGEMAVGYFMSHAPHSFFPLVNRGDAAILYCFVFLYLAIVGPGPWALDNIGGRRERRRMLRPAE
jgi:putative oxidoreductase